MRIFRRLYEWVLGWAETPYGTPALALVSLAEASVFPVPPDPLLAVLCLGRPDRALWYAIVCTVASVGGALVGYYIGWGLWHAVSGFFLAHIIDPEAFEYVGAKYNDAAFLAVLSAAVTPIPYKVFTITAGVFEIDLKTFVAASLLGRSSRFFIEAGLIYAFGERIRGFMDKYLNAVLIVFFVLLVAGVLVIGRIAR